MLARLSSLYTDLYRCSHHLHTSVACGFCLNRVRGEQMRHRANANYLRPPKICVHNLQTQYICLVKHLLISTLAPKQLRQMCNKSYVQAVEQSLSSTEKQQVASIGRERWRGVYARKELD